MNSNNRNRSRAASARGFVALLAMLAIGLGLLATPAAAAPFAYVPNDSTPGKVSVIDTGANPPAVVATIPVGSGPFEVAVAPDGKHAYVENGSGISVIDAATNTVVATVPVGSGGVAVAPDSKHVYVENQNTNNVSVIDAASNTVVATVPVGGVPNGVAVAPDGKHVYVAKFTGNTVSVIDTVSNTVVATIPVESPGAFAVAPDSKHVYVANVNGGSVSVIATATNTVVATIISPGGPPGSPQDVAVTPDGKHVYVTDSQCDCGSQGIFVIDTPTNTVVGSFIPVSGRFTGKVAFTPDGKHGYVTVGDPLDPSVVVFATATNMVVASIPVGANLRNDVAITPDGKHAFVTNDSGVSVIATATNTVVATIPVGGFPNRVGIIPPPPGVPFRAFSAQVEIALHRAPNTDVFVLDSHFTLRSTAPAIHPVTEAVKLQVGTFTTTIPPGSFRQQPDGSFTFAGVIHGVSVKARIKSTGTLRYKIHAEATAASLTGTNNTVYVTLIIGGDSGATSVTAQIFR